MSPDDFSQFDDPRVRDVMAAAANLVEELHRDYANLEIVVERRCDDLETALFAAQHSRPKANHGGYCKHGTGVPCEGCQLAALRDMQEAAQHSEPKEPGESWPCKGFAAPYRCTSEQCRPKHSKPKNERCARCGHTPALKDECLCARCREERQPADGCLTLELARRNHEKPVKFDEWGYGTAETNRFDVDGSKPGGKAFIAAIEGRACPDCKVVHEDKGWGIK